jgi:hypothetical protein
VLEGLCILPAVLERLAEREVQVKAILGRELAARQLRLHRLDVRRLELECLEVGETPIRFAELRRELDAPAVRLQAVGLPVRGLQRMAVAHPDTGVVRIVREHACIQVQRLIVVADAARQRGLQSAVARIERIRLDQLLHLRPGCSDLALTMQYDGIVVPSRQKARCQLQCALEQNFGVGISVQPCGDFRKHAHRRDVGRMLLQMGTQQRFRNRNPVFAQRRGRFEQARIVRRELDVLRVGLVGAARVADRSEVIAERTPCIRHFRLERDCASQRCDGAFTIASDAERQSELVMGGGPVRLRLCERFEDRPRRGRVASTSMRHAEQQRGERVARRDLEDFRCLFDRKPRLRGQQALRMRERGFERSDRF